MSTLPPPPLLLLFAAAAAARPHASSTPTPVPSPPLQPGAIAGIAIGAVLGLTLLAGCIFLLLRRARQHRPPAATHTRNDSGFAEPSGPHRALPSLEIPRGPQLKVYEPTLDAATGNWHIPAAHTLAPPPRDPRESLSPVSPLSAVSEGSNSTLSSGCPSPGFAPLSLRPVRADIRRSAASRTSSLRTWETAAESPRGHLAEPISAVGPPREVVFPTVAPMGSKETFGKRGSAL